MVSATEFYGKRIFFLTKNNENPFFYTEFFCKKKPNVRKTSKNHPSILMNLKGGADSGRSELV